MLPCLIRDDCISSWEYVRIAYVLTRQKFLAGGFPQVPLFLSPEVKQKVDFPKNSLIAPWKEARPERESTRKQAAFFMIDGYYSFAVV